MQSKTDRENEQAAITEAKTFKHKLANAFVDLHNDRLVPTPDYELVRKSGKLDRSTPKILAYFVKIRGVVEKHDRALSRHFGGRSALSIFNDVVKRLETAQSIQEVNLKALPQETLKLYEAMWRLLMLIEKMNRIARIAFDGQPHIVAEFNKKLLLRAHKRRSSSRVEPVADEMATGRLKAREWARTGERRV